MVSIFLLPVVTLSLYISFTRMSTIKFPRTNHIYNVCLRACLGSFIIITEIFQFVDLCVSVIIMGVSVRAWFDTLKHDSRFSAWDLTGMHVPIKSVCHFMVPNAQGSLWLYLYGSWIYSYRCLWKQCLVCEFDPLCWHAFNTMFCYKVYHCLLIGSLLWVKPCYQNQ
jgi:hypothetical protein